MLNYNEFVLESEESSRFASYFRIFLKNLMVTTSHSKTILNEWWSFPTTEELDKFLSDKDNGIRSLSKRKKLPNFKKELNNPVFFLYFTDYKKTSGNRHGSDVWRDEEGFGAVLDFRTIEIKDPFSEDPELIDQMNIPLCLEWKDGMENLEGRVKSAFNKVVQSIPAHIVSAARSGKKYGV